jgi:hypothetical protein
VTWSEYKASNLCWYATCMKVTLAAREKKAR